jgi:hypothetical protein
MVEDPSRTLCGGGGFLDPISFLKNAFTKGRCTWIHNVILGEIINTIEMESKGNFEKWH